MTIAHLIMAVLATGRLTELMTQDKITEKVRKRWPIYLWTCIRCVSVWAGIAATLLFYFFPLANYPFGLSWLYLVSGDLLGALLQRGRRQIRIESNHAGVSIDWAGYDPKQAVNVLKGIVSNVERVN
jgi:hypothetical protein